MRILIVEDDTGIANAVRDQLILWQYEAVTVQDFRAVEQEFLAFEPQLVILDIGLPFCDGYYWCRRIREVSNVPILFLSSASDNMNMVMAMNMGGDDFLPKPFDMDVLTAKVGALLRRAYLLPVEQSRFSHGGAVLDTGTQTLCFGEERVELTRNEYRILLCLMENGEKVVSREKLMERLWATDCFVDENTLSVNVNRLRRKLEAAGLTDFIRTKVGVGYYLA